MRAECLEQITSYRKTTVRFCKSFWNISEHGKIASGKMKSITQHDNLKLTSFFNFINWTYLLWREWLMAWTWQKLPVDKMIFIKCSRFNKTRMSQNDENSTKMRDYCKSIRFGLPPISSTFAKGEGVLSFLSQFRKFNYLSLSDLYLSVLWNGNYCFFLGAGGGSRNLSAWIFFLFTHKI